MRSMVCFSWVVFRAMALFCLWPSLVHAAAPVTENEAWEIGKPVVTYWGGPGYPGGVPLDDAEAEKLVKGGWNLVWCNEKDLDTAHRHGLRAHLYHPVLMRLDVLENPEARAELDALIGRVKGHPALYSYHLTDEPDAGKFPELAKIVAYLKEKDPHTLPYINLLPTYANNQQLGTQGDKVEAYALHLNQYVEQVKPELISYDHYQFTRSGDAPDYFLNLEMIRKKSLEAGVPFLNIVQASSWVPGEAASPHSPRVPGPDELRFLVNTTLAYGGQGISYYIYSHKTHEGGMVSQDGSPTALYHEAAKLNPLFVSIAKELQPLESQGAYHCGMTPNGTAMLTEEAPFRLEPELPVIQAKPGERVRGAVIGLFGPQGKGVPAATHAMVVNLDYKEDVVFHLTGTGMLEIFDATGGTWSAIGATKAELRLRRGDGMLLRRVP